MPRLNQRYEQFCQYFVLYPNATHAARRAGYSPRSAHNQGSRLLANKDIAARIAELRTEIAERHCANTDQLVAKLEAIYRRALEDHHFAAAGRAVELQAKLSGVAQKSAQPSVFTKELPGQPGQNDDK